MVLSRIIYVFRLVLLFREEKEEEKTDNVVFLEVLLLNQ